MTCPRLAALLSDLPRLSGDDLEDRITLEAIESGDCGFIKRRQGRGMFYEIGLMRITGYGDSLTSAAADWVAAAQSHTTQRDIGEPT